MNKQFFLGIGAQRAGTTWLTHYMRAHPQVGMSPIKELHYFDVFYHKKLCAPYEERLEDSFKNFLSKPNNKFNRKYLELLRCYTLRMEMKFNSRRYKEYFDLITEEHHHAIGEITPSYSILDKRGFEAVREFYNNAKFIFILRDPVDRYWSQLKHLESINEPGNFDINENIIKFSSLPLFYLRADYKRTLTELYKVVPNEDVCVIFYENLMDPDTHENELEKITEFLKIDFIKGDLSDKSNASAAKKLDKRHVTEIIKNYAHIYEYVKQNYEKELPDRWHERLSAI